MRLRSVSLSQLLPLAAALTAGLVGCDDTVVPALVEGEVRIEEDGGSDGADSGDEGPDSCFVTTLYKVEGAQYWFRGGGSISIVPRRAGQHGGCERLGSDIRRGFWVEACQHVDGQAGYARMRWNNELVGEVTLDEAFFTSHRTAVVSYDGDAGYFEYRVFTRRACNFSLPLTPVLTREEVAALEEGREPAEGRDGGAAPEGAEGKCLVSILYRAEGDQLQYLEDVRGTVMGNEMPFRSCVSALPASPAGICHVLAGYDGSVMLRWNDQPVLTFPFDEAFLVSGRTEVLPYEGEDGRRYELHVSTRPTCYL